MSSPSALPWLAVAVTRRTWDLAPRDRPVPGKDEQGGCYHPGALNHRMGGVP
jgi:hypothetical protein